MKNISFIFLLITISVYVLFGTQSNKKKRIGHNEKYVLPRAYRQHKRADIVRKEASLPKTEKGQREEGEIQGHRTMADKQNDFDPEKKNVKITMSKSYTKHQKYADGKYIKTSGAVNRTKKLIDGAQSETLKQDKNANSHVTVGDRKNTKDDEDRYIQTTKAEKSKNMVNDSVKEKLENDRLVKCNMTINYKNTSRDDRQREKKQPDKYFQSTVTIDPKERNDHLKKGNTVRKYSHDMAVTKNTEITNHKFEFRNAVNKIKQNILFGTDDYTEHLFRYHHTIQKRDVNRQIKTNWGENDEQNGINKNKCSIGKSDVERNCESLFQCCHNENKTNPNCYCDELCHLFDDCCHDTNTTNIFLSETNRLLKPRIHCAFVHRADTLYMCQMVESCSETYQNNSIAMKCENEISYYGRDPLLSLPVTDPLQVTYKNVFCALCNGIEDFRFWKMKYQRSFFPNKTLGNLYRYDWNNFPLPINLIIVFPPDDLSLRLCYGYAVKNTPEKRQEQVNGGIPSQCTSLQQFLYESWLHVDKGCLTAAWEYEYCYPDHVTYTNCSICEPHEFPSYVTRWTVKKMSVVFTFTLEKRICKNSHEIDGAELEDSLYICPTSTLLDPVYDLQYYIRIEGNFTGNTFDFLGTALFSYAAALTDSEIHLNFYKRHVYQPTKCDIQWIWMKMIYITQTDESYWNRLKELYEDLNWTYTEIHDRGKVVVSRLPAKSIQNYTVCDFSKFREKLSTYFIKENSAIFQHLPRTQRFCRNVHLTLEVNNSDAPVSDQLNELRVSESDCAMDVQSTHAYFDDVMTIVSNTLMGTGCITLVCSLVSTFVLKADESIPGLITRHMMVSTLFFQILFIVGIGATDNNVVCFAFGVALHYFALCVFAWMSICVGYLAKTLMMIKKLPGNMHDRDRKYGYPLICLGYILPAFIVIPSLVIDTCQCFPFSIDYGHGICFPSPSSYPEGLLVFIGPISVHIIFNIVCLTVSIHELSKAKVSAAVLCISRSYTPIYLKLCVFSGIGWVFGIATLVFPYNVIKLLFIVSCSTQGLFLSVITLCKIRVLRQLRSQLSASNKGKTNKTQIKTNSN